MLGICANGHITGYKHCSFCRADRVQAIEATPPKRALNARYKKQVDQNIRLAGGVPSTEWRRRFQ